ncbi:hypothetical protein CMUS01_03820 [Colletotrichum musicola]|uniref:Uncharacterized protein n=1 Tax=Colletotrichum musicola TaxID=2175873 RepID=A0A8H6NQP3_9PEZI|nr:hypothetical protein CMUS01_03820 [Colletotrichum musicola]
MAWARERFTSPSAHRAKQHERRSPAGPRTPQRNFGAARSDDRQRDGHLERDGRPANLQARRPPGPGPRPRTPQAGRGEARSPGGGALLPSGSPGISAVLVSGSRACDSLRSSYHLALTTGPRPRHGSQKDPDDGTFESFKGLPSATRTNRSVPPVSRPATRHRQALSELTGASREA